MQPYLDLLSHVLERGTRKADRTGTGTLSVFGPQLRFDLADGFPLVTTKAMFLRGVVEELLWFISGSTDVRDLHRRGVRFWDPWMDEDGTIGPGYGRQLRCVEHIARVRPRIYAPEAPSIVDPTVFGVGVLGDYDSGDPDLTPLQTTWREMMRRCYCVSAKAYVGYGAKGVHVDPKWHIFAAFQHDAKKLPNWALKKEWPDDFSLDKDVLHASNRYGPRTCMWASHEVQSANTSTNAYFEAVSPEGVREAFTSVGEANRVRGLNISAVHRCLTGKLRTHHGWSDFSYLDPGNGDVFRYSKVDPLRSLIASLKHDPDSRRHVISLWNPHEMDRMMLPPCHGVVIQFHIDNGKLNCLMYQRSGDLFLGVPVNIASYALLTHLLAQVVGLQAGMFVWQAGDAHIYSNHVDQVREQLSRPPRPPPRLRLNPEKSDLFGFAYEDIAFEGYEPWPAIRAEVAV